MKRFFIFLLVVIFTGCGQSSLGHYNYLTGEIACNSREVCLHEVGHKADHVNGMVSMSFNYQRNIEAYRMILWEHPELRNAFSGNLFTYPGLGSQRQHDMNLTHVSFFEDAQTTGYRELYADIVAWSDGKEKNCPANLRAFYDWDFIGDEMERLGYGR